MEGYQFIGILLLWKINQGISVSFASDSVGIVSPEKFSFEQPLELECGRVLPRFEIMVETYGQLNADRSNAILICHAL